jgi:hypothetical protein
MPDRRQHVPPGVTGDGEPRAGLGSLSGRETPGTATGPMASEVSNNTEWQLSELVDAVAAAGAVAWR